MNPIDDAPGRDRETEPLIPCRTATLGSDSLYWQERAMDAEQRAERATGFARSHVAPHLARLMKDQLVWTLIAQRRQLVSTHESSADMIAEMERRLEQIQVDFESRVETYEQRIAELQQALDSKAQINRELIADRIQMTRKALHGVALRHPNSPFAAKYLTAGGAGLSGAFRKGPPLSFSAIMTRRVSGEAT
jgi:hypothetical protein